MLCQKLNTTKYNHILSHFILSYSEHFKFNEKDYIIAEACGHVGQTRVPHRSNKDWILPMVWQN